MRLVVLAVVVIAVAGACTPRGAPRSGNGIGSETASSGLAVIGEEAPPETATDGVRGSAPALAGETSSSMEVEGRTAVELLPKACLENWPELPADLPEDARACLAPLLERRAQLATWVSEPPAVGAVPCALESLDDSGTLVETGKVERFTTRERNLRVEHVDEEYPDARTVEHVRIRFDRAGREKAREKHDEQFFTDPKVPDCENFANTIHRYDKSGWPKSSKKVISTCEGVDAGTITRTRKFRRNRGWVGAKVDVSDRGDARDATEMWMPHPAAPFAHVRCEYGECQCEVVLRSCEGAELGRARGGERTGAERWAWQCPVNTGG